MRLRITAVAALFCFLSATATAQIGNLGQFDNKIYHWGIQIGYIQTKFDLDFSQDDDLRRTMQGVTSYYTPGVHLAILNDLRLDKSFNVRLAAGVAIINRKIDYSWENGYLVAHHNAELFRDVESVYGDVALEFTLRAVRWHNFRPYLIGGGSYGLDLASLSKNLNKTNQAIVRLVPHDLRYTAGVGFDVFLRYVKFAIELKMLFGLADLKVEDPDVYIRSFDGLKSRTFMLGFTFE